ncbi:RHS repeat-associated core domain-containing protein, partial [Xanthomonas graminis]
VRRFLGTTNTYTVYDEAGHWMGDYDTNGKALQQAIWLDDLPVGVLAGTALNYVQPDHLGTPRTVIDPVRDVAIWKWDIKGEAFGNTPPDQDADRDGTAFVFGTRFPGQRYDSATGLNQNYFRDYDTSTGRYGQSDPIGMAAGNSTFAYVEARPLVARDVYGLQSSAMLGSEAARAIGPYAARNADGAIENDIPVSRLFDWGRNEPRPTIEVPLDEKILNTLYDASPFGMMSRVEGFVGAKLNNVNNQCAEDDELRKNCQALKDSILNTCYGLSPRKRMACYEAANTSYRQCMGYE